MIGAVTRLHRTMLLVGLVFTIVLTELWSSAPHGAPASEPRTALVIGNGTYQVGPLKNPPNDAHAVGKALKDVGFEVMVRENLDHQNMKRAILQFGTKLRERGGVGLFFYAGHGIQVGGRNYMMPTDTPVDMSSEESAAIEGVDVSHVLGRMDAAKNRVNIVILDACRDNPFLRGSRSTGRGLAAIDGPTGTLIAYAAAPGAIAMDGAVNSPYTAELVDAIRVPNLPIEQVFKRVRQGVQVRTQRKQTPWETSSLIGEFFFAAPAAVSPAREAPRAPAPSPPSQTEPPSILLKYPAPDVKVDRDEIPLVALVLDPVGLVDVEASVNGQKLGGIAVANDRTRANVNASVPLRIGENVIVITAVNKAGKGDQVMRFVHRTPPVVAMAPAPVVPAPPAPARSSPPKIQFTYPPADASLERERTPVVALVTDDVGIKDVELTVNGNRVPSVAAPANGPDKVNVNVEVPLGLGDNVFVITTTNKAGKSDQVIRIVTRVPPGMAPAPRKGERYAVVIGVGVYDNPQIPRLRFPENDARAVYELLTTIGGYKKDNVLLVSDTSQMKPTLANMKRALGEWLYKKAGRDDSVFMYYAGHGAPEVDASGTDRDGLAKYLIPRDADPESLFVTGLAMDDVETIFKRLESERVVFAIDTCFSGSAGGRTFTKQATRSGHMTSEFLERLSRSRGRVVISAAGPNELALEIPELKHGLFTHFLLRGLEGAADANRDRIVTVNELFNWVQAKVSDYARQRNGKQTPALSGAVHDLPLIALPN